jgi:hypothetical protein
MRLCKLKQAAAVGAVVLGFAMSGSSAWAVCDTTNGVNIDAQDPFTMNICAAVENTFLTDVTEPDFGNIGVTGWGGESGCLIMNPDGTFDEDNGLCEGAAGVPTIARIVSEDSLGTPNPGIPGELAITGAFPDQEIRAWFELATTTNEMPPLGGGGGPSLWITELRADVGATGVAGQDGVWQIDAAEMPEAADEAAADLIAQDPANHFEATTDGTGALDINIGATIQTDTTFDYAGGGIYDTDSYEGDFDIVLFW